MPRYLLVRRFAQPRLVSSFARRVACGLLALLLTFPLDDARADDETAPDAPPAPEESWQVIEMAGVRVGYAHVAISVGSRDEVDRLAGRMAADGVRVVSQPRETGDGYYEAVVEDPDGNLVEITE